MARGTPRTRLIDGHNVCYRDRELAPLIRRDPEQARRALEALVGDRPWHLFYDGGPGGVPQQLIRGRLALHYSGQGSADAAIGAWLRQHGGRGVVVVSDDREVQQVARSAGARWQATAVWLAEVRRSQAAAVVDDEPDRGPPSADEVDFWREQFGDG